MYVFIISKAYRDVLKHSLTIIYNKCKHSIMMLLMSKACMLFIKMPIETLINNNNIVTVSIKRRGKAIISNNLTEKTLLQRPLEMPPTGQNTDKDI